MSPNAIPAAPTSRPRWVIPLAGCLVTSRKTVPRMTRTAPTMTVTAAATDRVTTSRILLAAV